MIPYRTLLAALATPDDAALLVEVGARLLVDKPGKLVGLFTLSPTMAYGAPDTIAVVEVIQAQIADWHERSAATEGAFRKACEAQGLGHEWRAAAPADVGASARPGVVARTADLVLAAHSPGEGPFETGSGDIADLALLSSRPVLALPRGTAARTLGSRILVAWDGGREATRAAFGALPLLARADAVRLASITGALRESAPQFTPADDLAATFSRHGAKLEALSIRSDKPTVADELAAQALDFGADLIVMGCYGHSRLREFVFGGATRHMLRQMPAPLLMAN